MNKFPVIIFSALVGFAIMATRQPRGIRNNNPLNIENNPRNPWLGLATYQPDARFAKFDTMVYGIRAAAITLNNYRKLYGIDNIREIISRWAPEHENDTQKYIDFVFRQTGIAPDRTLNFKTDLHKLIKAMARMETGTVLNDEVIEKGIKMANVV